MQLEHEQRGKYLFIRAKGRLDAAWADFFTEELFGFIRTGQHHIVIDAGEMAFLSSAGIRALLQIYKELNTVQGSFLIVNATDFVSETLHATRFDLWLSKNLPEDMPAESIVDKAEKSGIEYFSLAEEAVFAVVEQIYWQPWQRVAADSVKRVQFPTDRLALGIGSSAGSEVEAQDRYGEFLAVAGNVVYQPPEEQGHPDYLIAEKQYVPQMHCLQLLSMSGEPGGLQRFAPTEKMPFYPVSLLLKDMLNETGGKAIAFVVAGEIEGLVGCFLIRSPGVLQESRKIGFPEVRDWLSFCSERSYPHQQALIVGVAARTADVSGRKMLSVLPSCPELSAHIHGAVFPYQPLQNGEIELAATVRKIFNGASPLAVMHLVDDDRPVIGLGESALIRGAGWFGALGNPEVLS